MFECKLCQQVRLKFPNIDELEAHLASEVDLIITFTSIFYVYTFLHCNYISALHCISLFSLSKHKNNGAYSIVL